MSATFMVRAVNARSLLVHRLREKMPTLDVRTRLPDPIQDHLPIARVLNSPGRENYVTSFPHVDVEIFGSDDSDGMFDLAMEVHDVVMDMGGEVVDGQLIDATLTISAPFEGSWAAGVQRSVAVYELQMRPNPRPEED